MIRRPTSPVHHTRLRWAVPVLARGVAAIAVAVLPVVAPAPGLGAQATPAPTADSVTTAQRSMGVVTVKKGFSIGWIGGAGVVVTSDDSADEVGLSATFTVANSSAEQSCYVATHIASKRLSVLRCPGVTGTALSVETRYPEPGTPVYLSSLQGGSAPVIQTQGGTITDNDVSFMKATRMRFSFDVPTAVAAGPVVNAEGHIVSTLLVAPDAGGEPIGLIPADLTKAISSALTLPDSFRSAAIIAVGRRSLIPAAVGLAVGVIWAIVARSGGAITKVLGLAALGIVGAVIYSIFTVLVVGPQSLLG